MKNVGLSDHFRAEVQALTKKERVIIGAAISDIQGAFGNPHVHSGIGLRKLRNRLYEARIDLGVRLLFEDQDECLFFFQMGNHKEIQKYLKSL